MLKRLQERYCAVRFGTEKTVGFPALNAIFDGADTGDSTAMCSGGGGLFSRIQIEFFRC